MSENAGGCLMVVSLISLLAAGLLFASGLTGGETIEAAAVSARIAMAVVFYIYLFGRVLFFVVIELLILR